jgi:glyoxylase-like metal-dependent hydrolase (beta-lactamase superfamily II)
MRELAKRLPLAETWPTGPEMRKALVRFGLDRDTPAAHIPMPALIAPGVYVVGQEKFGNLTYLIDCGPEGSLVIDPTFESEIERTLANVEKCGFPAKSVRWVINTHCHMDHAMADSKFRQMGAEIMVHEADAAAIEKASRVTAWYHVGTQIGVLKFPPSKIDRRLSDGEDLTLGNKTLIVIHTPGHTPGSACFLLQVEGKNLLISGDTVFYDGMLGWQLNPYADNRQYLASFEKLLKFTLETDPLRWDLLLPGHGAIAMDKAGLDVEKGRDMIAGDLAASREVRVAPHARPEYRKRMFGRPAAKVGM